MATVSQEVVDWAWALGSAGIPAGVKRTVCDHALDGAGGAVAASRLAQAPFAGTVAGILGGPEEASVIGGGRVGAASAAFANGVLIHALDFDDTHPEALVHPTAVVLPAALAIGEREGLPGRDVLTTAVAGFELVIRLGAAVRHGFHARGFHATSVCGVFASALVAARLLDLTREQAVNALGIAGSFASGSLEFLSGGSATKQLHPGWASHGGIVAAFLAAHGATGPATIIEGEAGLFRLFAATSAPAREITATLGERWLLSTTQIKPYPACQLSHASIDALKKLAPKLTDLAAIKRITFDVPAESVPIVCEPAAAKLRPRTPYEAKFSLQWCAAAMLVDGSVGVETFEPSQLARPEILHLAERIGYRSFEAEVAAASAPGKVEVETTGGTLHAHAEVSQAVTQEMIDDKLRLNVGDPAAAAELAQLFRSLESQASLDRLARSLRGSPARVTP
jgi:2-methylcitrate dehydratase PrpD